MVGGYMYLFGGALCRERAEFCLARGYRWACDSCCESALRDSGCAVFAVLGDFSDSPSLPPGQ